MDYKRRLRNFQLAEDNLKKELERLQKESTEKQYGHLIRDSSLLLDSIASEISRFDGNLKQLVGDSLVEQAKASHRQTAVIEDPTSSRILKSCLESISSSVCPARTVHLSGPHHRTAQSRECVACPVPSILEPGIRSAPAAAEEQIRRSAGDSDDRPRRSQELTRNRASHQPRLETRTREAGRHQQSTRRPTAIIRV